MKLEQGQDNNSNEYILSKKSNIYYLTVFCYSTIALSAWSFFFIVEKLGFSFFLYELYLLPILVIYFRSHHGSKLLLRKDEVFVYTMLVISLCNGLIINNQYLVAQVTTFRTVLYYVLIMHFVSRLEVINLNLIKIMCLGATVGDILYMFIIGGNNDQTGVNLVALILLVSIPIIQEKVIEIIVLSFISFVCAIKSSFRIAIILVIITEFLTLLFVAIKRKRKKMIFLLMLFVVAISILIINIDSLSYFFTKYLHMNEYSVFRVVTRMKYMLLLQLDMSMDDRRGYAFSILVDRFGKSIIPKGLIGKEAGYYSAYKDAPLIFLYDTFGSIGAWFVSIWFTLKGLHILKISNKHIGQNNYVFLFGILTIPFVFMLVFNGCFLMDTYEVCLAAIVFGYWFNPNIRRLTVVQ